MRGSRHPDASTESPIRNRQSSYPQRLLKEVHYELTVGSVGYGFVVHGQLISGSRSACMAFLFVASQLWREWGRRRRSGRHLRTHSQASSPRSVALPQLPSPSTLSIGAYIWYTVLQSIPVFVQGTCTPQVHAHVGRTVHPSGGSGRNQNGKSLGRRRVTPVGERT